MQIKPQIALNQVLLVYSGGEGCRCGCQGYYRANPWFVEEARKARGYAYSPKEIGGPTLLRAVRLINNAPLSEVTWDKDGEWAEIQPNGPGTRVYCIYFRTPVKLVEVSTDLECFKTQRQPR